MPTDDAVVRRFVLLIIILIGTIFLFSFYMYQKHYIDKNIIDDTYTQQLKSENKSLLDQLKMYKKKEKEINELTKFIIYLQPKLEVNIAKLISEKIIKHSKNYGLPPALIASLISRESSFDTLVVSTVKCVGLMQINPKAHKDKIKNLKLKYYDLFIIDHNIKLGCMILYEYYQKDQDIRKALIRYVGGNHDDYVSDILASYANYQINFQEKKEIKNKEEKDIDIKTSSQN